MNPKTIKRNLIMMLAVAGVLLTTALVCYFAGRELCDGLESLKTGIREARSAEEIGDVEGYGIIVSGIGYLAGGFAYIVFVIFFVIIPGFFGVWLLSFALLAWLVAIKTKSILAYRILMGFDLAGVGLITLLGLLGLTGGTVILLPITAVLGTVLFFGIRNTYTYRIRQNPVENLQS